MAKLRVIVVGAGVFGCWTAWHLQKQGADVTLLDAWGVANSRSSSGDESRILRIIYGKKRHYMEMTERSLKQWESLQSESGVPIFRRTGVLWLFGADESFVQDGLPFINRSEFSLEQWDPAQAEKRFPQVNYEGVRQVYLESRAGFLLARQSVRTLATRFQQAGGKLRIIPAAPQYASEGGGFEGVILGDGSVLKADRYVFACGPWLGQIFPEWLGKWIRPTRQEVFYFGTPAGDTSLSDAELPVWLDEARASWYGIPGTTYDGFKISSNEPGEVVDPSHLDRVPNPTRLANARLHLGFRFPKMMAAPLLESRVCQFENTPDKELIVDFFPRDSRVIAVGGGSGHGFKMGPAVGELAAQIARGEVLPPALFQVRRFTQQPSPPPA